MTILQKKIVGINFSAIPAQKTGIGFLTINLVEKMIPSLSHCEFVLFTPKSSVYPEVEFKNSRQISCAPDSVFGRIIWEQLTLPRLIKKFKIDIMFNPNYIAPCFVPKNVSQITVILDLTYRKYPFRRQLVKSLYFNLFIPISLIISKHIVAISHFTKKEIEELYPIIKTDKIRVMHLGPGNIMVNTPASNKTYQKFCETHKLHKKEYFLFVSTIEPSKNLLRNIKAFKEFSNLHPQYKFVITGKKGWDTQTVFNYVAENQMESSVIFTGYVEAEVL